MVKLIQITPKFFLITLLKAIAPKISLKFAPITPPPPRPQTLNQRIKARSKLLKKLIRFRFLHYLGIGPRSSFTLFESLELGVGSEHRLLEPNLTLIPNSFGKRNFMQPMGRPKACFTFLSIYSFSIFVSRITMDHRTPKKI